MEAEEKKRKEGNGEGRRWRKGSIDKRERERLTYPPFYFLLKEAGRSKRRRETPVGAEKVEYRCSEEDWERPVGGEKKEERRC